jgi:branched-chain amino acid transport system ATP-binding protein
VIDMTFFEVRHLDVFFAYNQVVFDVNFKVEEGQVCSILGANGAGKTSILNGIIGLYEKKGQVFFQGRDISIMETHNIIRSGVAYVPEMRGTFQELTVAENLLMGSYMRKDKEAIKNDLDMVYTYFPILKQRLYQQAGTLSGGEQQMLAIARAILQKPKLLLMDEPSLGLAPLLIKAIFSSVRRICDEAKISVLLIEQNVTLALGIADYVYLIETGRVVLSGTPDVFKNDKSIQKAYLGIT